MREFPYLSQPFLPRFFRYLTPIHLSITMCVTIRLQSFLLISPMQGQDDVHARELYMGQAKFLRDLARSIRQPVLIVHGEIPLS